MALPKSPTVIEHSAQFDLSTAILHHSHSHSLPHLPISCLAVSTISDSQTLIYIGVESGELLLFQFSSPPDSRNVSFLRSVLIARGSSVDSVHFLRESAKVLVQSNGLMFLVDSILSQPVKKVNSLKGVSVIARRFLSTSGMASSSLLDYYSANDTENASSSFLQKLGSGIRTNGVKIKESANQLQQPHEGSYLFAIITGKRLVLADFNSASGSFLILREFQCCDGVETMVWIDDSIIIGTSNGYTLFSCITGRSGVIFSLPDVSSSPRLKLLQKDWKVLLLVDNVGVIMDGHGQPVGGSLVFKRGLDSVADISLYVAVVKDGKMDLYHKKTGKCFQTVMFAGEGAGPCLVADEDNGNGNLLVVATPSKVSKHLMFHIRNKLCQKGDSSFTPLLVLLSCILF